MDSDERRTQVRVPTPDGEEVLVDPRSHREDVVERLLGRGVSVETLRRLLPEWAGLIDRVDHRLTTGPVATAIAAGSRNGPSA